MKSFLLYAYEFLAEFLPLSLALVLLRRGRGRFSRSRRGWCLPVLFGLYIMAVFHVTWPGTLYDLPDARFGELLRRVNFIPFSRDIHVPGYLLNMVMFLPFGFLLPLLRQRKAPLPAVAAGGLGLSLLIEASQLISDRGPDVDDLIMNTLGAAGGFLLYKLWDRLTHSRFQGDLGPGEPAVCVLALYLGRFLLFNHLGLIELLYR